MTSYVQTFPSRCGAYPHNNEVPLWLVVDGTKRRDLADMVAAGELRRFTSTSRGAILEQRSSLLIGPPASQPGADVRKLGSGLAASAGAPARGDVATDADQRRVRGVPRRRPALRASDRPISTRARARYPDERAIAAPSAWAPHGVVGSD